MCRTPFNNDVSPLGVSDNEPEQPGIYNWTMFIEAERLDREVNDYHWALTNASFIGHENIVRLLLDRGTDNYASVLRAAE